MNSSDEQLDQRQARAYSPAWLTLLAGLIVSGTAASWFWREAERLDTVRFHTAVTNLIEQLDMRTERYAEQLERFTDLIASQPELSEAAWREYVARLGPASNLPAFLELAYATNTALPSRAQVEEAIRKAQIDSQSGESNLRPLRHSPPLHLARHWRNASTISPGQTGDWLHEPPIQNQWWGTGNGRMISSPRRMMPGTHGEPLAAISLFVPVFVSDLVEISESTPVESMAVLREYRFKGVVVGTFGWQAFLDTAFPGALDQVALEAFASAKNAVDISPETWMNGNGAAQARVLQPGFQARFQHTQSWPFYRERWQLAFYSTKLFDRQSTRGRSWASLGGGVVLTMLWQG